MAKTSVVKSAGGCPIKVRAPMERAKPKIKSDRDSMRALGVDRSFPSAIMALPSINYRNRFVVNII